jgi:hypothetical protein
MLSLSVVSFHAQTALSQIEDGAFADSGVEQVFIPCSLRSVGSLCFANCAALREVTCRLTDPNVGCIHGRECSLGFPKRLATFGKRCFSGTRALLSMVYTNDALVTRVSRSAFAYSSLTIAFIPQSVEVVEADAFRGSARLREVRFERGSRMQRIEQRAFFDTQLDSIHLPPALEFVDGSAFPFGTDFAVDVALSRFVVEKCILFDRIDRALVRWLHESHTVRVAPSVCAFGVGCFSHCSVDLAFVYADACELTRIDDRAFAESALTQLAVPASVGRSARAAPFAAARCGRSPFRRTRACRGSAMRRSPALPSPFSLPPRDVRGLGRASRALLRGVRAADALAVRERLCADGAAAGAVQAAAVAVVPARLRDPRAGRVALCGVGDPGGASLRIAGGDRRALLRALRGSAGGVFRATLAPRGDR